VDNNTDRKKRFEHPNMSNIENHPSLYYLKLGGSLITEKSRAHVARQEVLSRLADEIGSVFTNQKEFMLIIGHGSGSFGHIPAKRYGTRAGVASPEGWRGFAEVWYEATSLTRLVVDAFYAAGLPVISFSPSASVTSLNGQVKIWDLNPIRAALESGLLPVVHGDVVFDEQRGGTILSTEDLFAYLAGYLPPDRILLAGLEEGVWEDYPKCTRLIPTITPASLPDILPSLGGSDATDVTGGMLSKVQQSLALVQKHPGLHVQVFSGAAPGNLQRALTGEPIGTVLRADLQDMQ